MLLTACPEYESYCAWTCAAGGQGRPDIARYVRGCHLTQDARVPSSGRSSAQVRPASTPAGPGTASPGAAASMRRHAAAASPSTCPSSNSRNACRDVAGNICLSLPWASAGSRPTPRGSTLWRPRSAAGATVSVGGERKRQSCLPTLCRRTCLDGGGERKFLSFLGLRASGGSGPPRGSAFSESFRARDGLDPD